MTATPAPRRARPGKRWINLPPARAVAPERYAVTDLSTTAPGRFGYAWQCHLCVSGAGQALSQATAEHAAQAHVGAAHDGLRVVTR